jgi:hypothetical protein
VDSSSAEDAGPTEEAIAAFSEQFRQAGTEKLSHAWLVSHRPVWAAKAGEESDRSTLRTLNATLEQAWGRQPIPGIDVVVSGHTHLFELLSFRTSLPPQLVVGNRGTDLAHRIKTPLKGQTIGGATVADGVTVDDFGYALIEPMKGGESWSVHLHDKMRKKQKVCTIAGGKSSCAAP